MKKAGILLPITSLPSDYGIGCFSLSAYKFADNLKKAGQSFWQILPLTPTSYGDSPYQSPSAFAGNPYLISLKDLISDGLLTKKECDEADFGDDASSICYEKLYNTRYDLLKKAFLRSDLDCNPDFIDFTNENSDWLDDYSLFMAVKDEFGEKAWHEWDKDIRLRKADAVKRYTDKLEGEIKFHKFIQFMFYRQWARLKKYINALGISVIGDIPIYVAMDSADVWSNPHLFELDENLLPINVAGCPPDGFSKTGQLWGNPLYRWDNHKKDGYSWWIKRLKHNFSLYDYVRIDHFRGFDEYYSIPSNREDAVVGEWKKGPGLEFFNAVKNALGRKNVIAEDLGFITDSVKKLVKETGFSGIKVLEFAFDSRDTGNSNDYLPHNYPQNCVAYTATHDNQTLKSWFLDITEKEKKLVRQYLCDFYTPDDELNNPLISTIMMSRAKICIVPIQDYMHLDDKARINTPSTVGDNWKWRLKKGEFDDKLCKEIFNMTKRYSRC